MRKPSFIKRCLEKLHIDSNYYNIKNAQTLQGNRPMVASEQQGLSPRNSMRFNLFRATGGYVIEIQKYDIKTDENNTRLYIVNEKQSLGKEIEKIITMEMLR